jgi:hypothetical protein
MGTADLVPEQVDCTRDELDTWEEHVIFTH